MLKIAITASLEVNIVIIREYADSDFYRLIKLYKDFFNEMRVWQGWEQLKLDDREAEEITRESLDKDSWVFVAVESGKLIGFARVQLWDGAYFIREVFVAKAFRRKSLGSELLTKCECLVKEKGETSLYLSVEPKHSVSLKFLIHNNYDTLNMLELRKDIIKTKFVERQGEIEILGHRLYLLKRKD